MILCAVILILLWVITGCLMINYGNNNPSFPKDSRFTWWIISFHYYEWDGMSYSYNYSINTDNKIKLTRNLSHWAMRWEDEVVKIDESVLTELESKIESWNIKSWNGFEKYADDIYDGMDRSINIWYWNGERISAKWYMRWPKWYRDWIVPIIEYLDSFFEE